jgi:alpha-glucosidase
MNAPDLRGPGRAPSEVHQNEWWRTGVLYQIYTRSFADSNGDGIGDIPGIIERLDYLEWLGVGGLWLTPIMPSPNADWGYDVADYCDVHPDYGTLDDVDRLVAEAERRGMRIIFDIVPNHTSDEHHWFESALKGRGAAYRDFYVWADPSNGGPPNNWISAFEGGAWTYDESSGQFYLHNFTPHQPDLDWWNEDVRDEFDRILRFWYDRGIAGFRIDVAHALIKDQSLRDNDPTTEADHPFQRQRAQRFNYSMNRPEVHDIFKRWRKLGDEYNRPRILVGETFVYDLAQWASFYGGGTDELNLAFNFPFALGELEVEQIKEVVRASEAAIPPEAWPVWMASNHDLGRAMTRWCRGDEDKCRLVIMLLLTLRGTPFLYYGDEIGMADRKMAYDELRDPVGLSKWPDDQGRDGGRTPMQWNGSPGAGFTNGDATPWLPFDEPEATNVESQRDDPKSVLNYTRDLIALRHSTDDLTSASYEVLDSPEGTWVFERGGHRVALNMSGREVKVSGVSGRVLATTRGVGGGELKSGSIDLAPWTGVIVATARHS